MGVGPPHQRLGQVIGRPRGILGRHVLQRFPESAAGFNILVHGCVKEGVIVKKCLSQGIRWA